MSTTDHSPSLADDLAFAQRLADAADAVAMLRFDSPDLHVQSKDDASFVTEADIETERALRGLIEAERPGDAIFGEEFGSTGESRRQWIVDPIDGTHNYLRGIPMWSTLISLAIDGVPQVGVVSQPAIGRRWWGATGEGAWTNTPENGIRRIQVSDVDSLERASISFQSIQQWDQAGYLDSVITLSRSVWRDRGYGDAWPYMLLAEGRIEFVAEFDVKEYDIAAHIPIIREAGGTFTDIDGTTSISSRSSLATNTHLHEAFLSLIHSTEETR